MTIDTFLKLSVIYLFMTSLVSQLMEFAEKNKNFCAHKAAKGIFGSGGYRNVNRIGCAINRAVENGGLLVSPLACSCTKGKRSGRAHRQFMLNKKPELIQGDIPLPVPAKPLAVSSKAVSRELSHLERVAGYAKKSKTGFCVHEIMDLIDAPINRASAIISILVRQKVLGLCSQKENCKFGQKKHSFYYWTGKELVSKRKPEPELVSPLHELMDIEKGKPVESVKAVKPVEPVKVIKPVVKVVKKENAGLGIPAEFIKCINITWGKDGLKISIERK